MATTDTITFDLSSTTDFVITATPELASDGWQHVEWNPNQIMSDDQKIMRDDQKIMDGMTDRDKEGIEERDWTLEELFEHWGVDNVSAALALWASVWEDEQPDCARLNEILEAALHD